MIGRRSRFGDRHRGRETFWRFTRLLVFAAAIAAVGSYAYRVGESAGQARAAKLAVDLERFQKSDLNLRDRVARLAQRSGRAEEELEELRRRYVEDVPQGRSATLVARLRDQLQAGVDPERLAFLIEASARSDDCSTEPQTKRFMLATGIGDLAASVVRFDDRITVAGRGRAARNEQGLTEAWYDPQQPVQLEFRRLDGEVVDVAGILPLTHRMAVGEQEFRFSIIPGERSFVEVTAQVCELPSAQDEPTDQADGSTPDGASAPGGVTPGATSGERQSAVPAAPAGQVAAADLRRPADLDLDLDLESSQNDVAIGQ